MAEMLLGVAYGAALRAADFYVWLCCLIFIAVLVGILTFNMVAPA